MGISRTSRGVQLVDYKVRVINSDAGTAAAVRVVIESQDEDGTTWGTVGVNENVIEASWDALVDSIEYKLCKDEQVAERREDTSADRDRRTTPPRLCLIDSPCPLLNSVARSNDEMDFKIVTIAIRSRRRAGRSGIPFWERARLLPRRGRRPAASRSRSSSRRRT